MENKNQMNNEEMDNIIRLTDEIGKETEFEFLDLVEYDGEEYIILLPVEVTEDDDGGILILQVTDTGDADNEEYTSITDETVLDNVFGIFKKKFKEEFDFSD